MKEKRKEIVIIGGGYGGLRAAEQLCGHHAVHITLLDKNPYHYMQTEVYGYIAGRFDMSDIAIDLERFTRGLKGDVTFLQAEVTEIDRERREVVTTDGRFPYDYAILAAGARTGFFSFIEGVREHTHGIKDIQRAFAFRQAFEKRLADKLRNRTFHRAGDLHIAIAGAGLSGVEVAAEMAYTLKRYEKILAECSRRLTISLIDAAPTVLPGMDPRLIAKADARLRELGIEIRTDAFIQKIDARSISFKDGSRIPFDFIIFTAGIEAAPLTRTLRTPRNRIGQIVPGPFLDVVGYENLYAIGDCVEIRDAKGVLQPPTAQMAEKSAAAVADTIVRELSGKARRPFDARMEGIFIALGGRYALGELYGRIVVEGLPAWWLKKAITLLYRMGLEMRVNAGYRKRDLPV